MLRNPGSYSRPRYMRNPGGCHGNLSQNTIKIFNSDIPPRYWHPYLRLASFQISQPGPGKKCFHTLSHSKCSRVVWISGFRNNSEKIVKRFGFASTRLLLDLAELSHYKQNISMIYSSLKRRSNLWFALFPLPQDMWIYSMSTCKISNASLSLMINLCQERMTLEESLKLKILGS